jgi:hypothetical protein
MGHWQERYESVPVGNTEVDGEIITVYSMVGKKDRWIPRMIPDPILEGLYVYDPADTEPINQ